MTFKFLDNGRVYNTPDFEWRNIYPPAKSKIQFVTIGPGEEINWMYQDDEIVGYTITKNNETLIYMLKE